MTHGAPARSARQRLGSEEAAGILIQHQGDVRLRHAAGVPANGGAIILIAAILPHRDETLR